VIENIENDVGIAIEKVRGLKVKRTTAKLQETRTLDTFRHRVKRFCSVAP